MGIKEVIKRVLPRKGDNKGYEINGAQRYDYSTRESREITIPFLYDYAKAQKEPQTSKFKLYDDYYNNIHKVQEETAKFCNEKGLPFIPAVIPDAYIHVESQIIPDIPGFEFNGRDDDLDSQKAKQREYVVKYVLDDNKVEAQNTDNERQLNKLGNALWYVGYDYDLSGPGYRGKIVVEAIDPSEIFPDPAAIDEDDCEFIDRSFRMHRMKVMRKFSKDLKRLGISINELSIDGNFADTEIYNSQYQDVNTDTMQVIYHWFRQPFDGSEKQEITIPDPMTGKDKTISIPVEWEAGDIALSIFIGSKEIRYVPKYWVKTGRQNKHYPISKYCKIPVAKSFWDKSEIEPIKELIDAADRELSMTLLNDTFNANDIILMVEDAAAENSTFENTPGAHWKVTQQGWGKVQRLGGLSNLNGGLKDTINLLRDIIKQTVGNFDVNMGDAPPNNVKTLGGLVELKEQGNKRQNIKKADRMAGFARLYELIDWTALEFYDDDRMIYLGAEKVDNYKPDPMTGKMVKKPVIFKFNSDNLRVLDANATDTTQEAQYYYPVVDAKIDVGDDIQNSKAMTLMATENLLNKPINAQNWKIIAEMLDVMGLPNRQELKDWLEQTFGQGVMPGNNPEAPQLTPEELIAGLTPDEQAYLQEHPEVLEEMMGGNPNAMPSL